VKSPRHGLLFFIEEIALFYELVKWLVLAFITGIVVGSFSALFLRSLEVASSLTTDPGAWRFFLLPAGLLASLFVVRLSHLEGLQLKRSRSGSPR
jgi:hypothetical protein